MLVFLILIIFFFLSYPKIQFKNFNDGFISKETTTMINGIFVLLVFMAHFVQYTTLDKVIDLPYMFLYRKLDQLIVTTFLFFSGFGMYESYKKKGINYINSIPSKRIFKLLVRFSIAICCFLFFDFLLGKTYSTKTILFSFIAWDSVGNSNWYIFVILCLYFIFYLSFILPIKNDKLSIIFNFILSLMLILFLKVSGKDSFWYNTIFCFSAGMIFSFYKDKIINLFKGNANLWKLSIIFCVFLFLLGYKLRNNLVFYELHAVLFVLIILLLMMKIKFKSKFLMFMGENVFSIYIFQRIPMMVGQYVGLNNKVYIYFAISFGFTILISIIFEKVCKKINI